MKPVPGRIIEVYSEGSNRIGLVEFDGKRRAIYLSLVPDAKAGDHVRFHAGFATERADPNENQTAEASTDWAGHNEKVNTGFETCRASRLLSELDPRQLRKLIPLAQNEVFEAGELIFKAGDKSRALHLIASGSVALEEISGTQAVPVQTLRAGMMRMGWVGAHYSGARTHFQARALSRVRAPWLSLAINSPRPAKKTRR